MRDLMRIGMLLAVGSGSAGSSHGQSFNLDLGPLAPNGVPPSGYGAAAGQAGEWFALTGGPPYAFTLNGLDGSPTGVTSHCAATGNGQGDFYFNNLISSRDHEKLIDDVQDVGNTTSEATWTFSGLQNGTYLVFTYAIAPDNSSYRTLVTSPATGQTDVVGGVFPAGHQENVTFSLHCIEVTTGEIVITLRPGTGFASCNGFQIVQRDYSCAQAAAAFCHCVKPGVAPCANEGLWGNGCANSQTDEGAHLVATGTTNPDTIQLHASGARQGQAGLFFQGAMQVGGGAGSHFGDGLRCASSSVVRLQVVVPGPGGMASTSVSIGAKGGVGPGSGTRYYQYWYRDPVIGPCGTGFNLTNGYRITW